LYAADVRGAQPLRVASVVFDDLGVAPAERTRATHLLRIVEEQSAALDAALTAVTVNWRLERLGAIERSLLRLGAAELIAGDTPPRVVLQEMIRLAERFGGLQSARFVNGVLDALARHLGKL
jgi:N utilization substance protein B